jgi:hypothetical protein
MSNFVGDFSFVKDDMFRKALEHDYSVVCKLDLWSYFENIDPQTIFSFDEKLNAIDQWYDQHSGASFHISMKNMQIIARYGWGHLVWRHLSEK